MSHLAALLPAIPYGLACIALVGVLATLAAAATVLGADRRRIVLVALLAATLVAPVPLWVPALIATALLILPRRRPLRAANDNEASFDWSMPDAPLRIVA